MTLINKFEFICEGQSCWCVLYNGKDNHWQINWWIQIMRNVRFLSNHNRALLAHQCTFREKIARFNIFQFYVIKINHRVQMIIVRRAGLLWSQQDFEWRWSVPLFKCLTVLEFSFILFDLCLLITFFNSIMNYVPIVTFWIFTYHKIWILSIMFCFIWSYWIIYLLACLEVSWRVVS